MDGEFGVTAFDKGRKRLVVFNDVLGRLPASDLHRLPWRGGVS